MYNSMCGNSLHIVVWNDIYKANVQFYIIQYVVNYHTLDYAMKSWKKKAE